MANQNAVRDAAKKMKALRRVGVADSDPWFWSINQVGFDRSAMECLAEKSGWSWDAIAELNCRIEDMAGEDKGVIAKNRASSTR